MNKQQMSNAVADIVEGTPQRVVANVAASKEPTQGTPAAAPTGPTAAEAATATPEVQVPEEQTAAPAAQDAPAPDAKAEALLGTIDSPDLRAALRAKQMAKRGRPRKDRTNEPEEKLIHSSFVVREEQWEKLRAISLRETLTMRELVTFAIEKVIERYEQKHGPIATNEGPKNINDIF